MRVHAALWKFAETDGNKYAKKYAAKRKTLSGIELSRSDTDWLVGRGGARLRSMWKNLSPDTRRTLLNATPDHSVPFDEYGVHDERFSASGRGSEATPPSDETSTCSDLHITSVAGSSSSGDGADVAKDAQARFQRARTKYFKVLVKEKRVDLQIAYDKGSLAGVLSAAVNMAENAIQLARAKGRAKTAQEAFEEVAKEVSDVFESIEAITDFDPEPTSDGPSPSFSTARITASRSNYRSQLLNLHGVLGKRQSREDPDKPLLPSTYKHFGRQQGFPVYEPDTD